MSDTKDFAERVRERLKQVEEELQRQREATEAYMAALERRQEQFNAKANHLTEAVLRPRVAELAAHFDNASLEADVRAHRVCCRFAHTARFPATASLELRVTCDESIEHLTVSYHADILPVFIRYERENELTLPLDEVDDDKVIPWVEERLLGFLDSYLQIELHDQYQRENLVTDPVCGMRLSKVKAIPLEHHGHTYYFCATRCRDRFEKNPGRYVAVV